MEFRKLRVFLSGIACAILTATSLEAWGSKEVFAKYPNAYFVETGSFMGAGIRSALDAGFPVLYSIELSPVYYQYCRYLFRGFPQVHLFEGDSAQQLDFVLDKIDAPATFWLDGHCSGGNTARGDSGTPILLELERIARHPIKTHTILIDDVRLFGSEEFDFISLDQVVERIRRINPLYTISFEDGYVPGDILVARIP